MTEIKWVQVFCKRGSDEDRVKSCDVIRYDFPYSEDQDKASYLDVDCGNISKHVHVVINNHNGGYTLVVHRG